MIFDLLAATGESKYYLFKYGNTYPSRTGGWSKSLGYSSGYTEAKAVIGDKIYLMADSKVGTTFGGDSTHARTYTNYIDLGNHTKVCLDVESYKGTVSVYVTRKNELESNRVSKNINSTGTFVLDISNWLNDWDDGGYNGEYRIHINAYAGSASGHAGYSEANIKKVWFE